MRRLLHRVFEYDFSNYLSFQSEITEYLKNENPAFIERWSQLMPEKATLRSNCQNEYFFGPNGFTIRAAIEKILRCGGDRHMSFNNYHSLHIQTQLLLENDLDRKDIYITKEPFDTFLSVKSLEKQLPQILEIAKTIPEPYVVTGPPHVLNELVHDERFTLRPFCLTNLDSPCFVKTTDHYLNDQMVDWQSGLNFYTCSFGHKHVLPIFLKIDDRFHCLLNMTRWAPPMTDEMVIHEFEPCECGRVRAIMTFTPHKRNFIDRDYNECMNLVNQLESKTCYLQFVQGDGIEVYSDVPVSEKDAETISRFFGSPATFIVGRFFRVGLRKIPAFWKKLDTESGTP